MSNFDRKDVYTRVTERIISDLEQGIRTWMKPWSVEHTAGRITKPLRHNGTPYRGMNILLLWGEAMAKGYTAPIWMTFKQALELDAHVRKGEHGSLVVYADRIRRSETDEKGDAVERIEAADRFFAATGITLRHGGNRAYYAEGPNAVQMPPFESFRDAESYAATLAHECIHATKHPKRLAREFGRKRWGDEGYAAEELVAELGAAFLCADLGITPDIREDHAAYMGSS